MRRRLMGIIAASAVAAVVAVFGGSTPAYAATWTVGPTPPTGPFTFNGSAGTTLLTDTNTGTQLTCTSSTATGNATRGAGQAPNGIARITNTTFSGCAGPLGITFSVTHVGTWLLNAGTYAAGVTNGNITAIQARLSGPLCSATVTGSVSARFTNSANSTSPAQLQVLTTNSGLVISAVSGCFGLLRNGDRATFSGTYRITNPVPMVVTSP